MFKVCLHVFYTSSKKNTFYLGTFGTFPKPHPGTKKKSKKCHVGLHEMSSKSKRIKIKVKWFSGGNKVCVTAGKIAGELL